jgi:hypothetical protein
MRNEDHDQNPDQNPRGTRWERGEVGGELEAALARYVPVEPRVGLEQRVLARLKGERDSVRGWTRWSVASAAVALAVVVVMVGAGVEVWKERVRGAIVVSQAEPRQMEAVHAGENAQHRAVAVKNSSERPKSTGRNGSRSLWAAGHAASLMDQPKLEQFPSPRPLSEQEKILASYVKRYPETAELVAKARAAESLQDSLEEAAKAEKQNSE